MAFSTLGSGAVGTMAAQTGSFSVTVPSGTTLAVIGFTGFGGTANGFDGGTCTLGGSSMTIVGADNSTSAFFTALCYIVNPSSGSQTLAWSWVGTQWTTYGGPVLAAYFSGVDTSSPVRSTDAIQDTTMNAATTGTLTAVTGDLLVAVSGEYCNNVNRSCTWTGATELVAGSPAGGGVAAGKGDISLSTGSPTGNQAVSVVWDFTGDGGICAVVFKPAAAGSSIDAGPGSYSHTGQAATLAAGRVFADDPGSYAVTGAAAAVVAARLIAATPASYTVTGADATLTYIAVRQIDAQPDAFAVSGADATLAAGYVFDAQPAAYTVTGADAGLNVAVPGLFALNSEPGDFTVTGGAATTIATRLFNAEPATYTVTGIAAVLFGEHSIAATPGAYLVTGSAVTVLADRTVNAAAGTVTFTGVAANIGSLFDSVIDADAGNVIVTGSAATLLFVPGRARMTSRGVRIRWNTAGRITQNREGAVS